MTSVVAIKPLGDEAALEWLKREAPISITVSDLARQWAWERTRASRKLARWVQEGHVTREIGPGGRSIISRPLTVVGPEQHTVRPAQFVAHGAQTDARPAQPHAHGDAPAGFAVLAMQHTVLAEAAQANPVDDPASNHVYVADGQRRRPGVLADRQGDPIPGQRSRRMDGFDYSALNVGVPRSPLITREIGWPIREGCVAALACADQVSKAFLGARRSHESC